MSNFRFKSTALACPLAMFRRSTAMGVRMGRNLATGASAAGHGASVHATVIAGGAALAAAGYYSQTRPVAEAKQMRGHPSQNDITAPAPTTATGGSNSDRGPVVKPRVSHGPLVLYSGSAHPELGLEVAFNLGVQLGSHSTTRFKNGETGCVIHESVRDCDVFIIQPTCNPSPNEYLMEVRRRPPPVACNWLALPLPCSYLCCAAAVLRLPWPEPCALTRPNPIRPAAAAHHDGCAASRRRLSHHWYLRISAVDSLVNPGCLS